MENWKEERRWKRRRISKTTRDKVTTTCLYCTWRGNKWTSTVGSIMKLVRKDPGPFFSLLSSIRWSSSQFVYMVPELRKYQNDVEPFVKDIHNQCLGVPQSLYCTAALSGGRKQLPTDYYVITQQPSHTMRSNNSRSKRWKRTKMWLIDDFSLQKWRSGDGTSSLALYVMQI